MEKLIAMKIECLQYREYAIRLVIVVNMTSHHNMQNREMNTQRSRLYPSDKFVKCIRIYVGQPTLGLESGQLSKFGKKRCDKFRYT